MRALSSAELLDAWEAGLGCPVGERPLALLAVATGSTQEALADLSIGQRDEQLLALRAATFGSVLVSIALCPRCEDTMEMTLDVHDVAPTPEGPGGLSVTLDDYKIEFRLPTTRDLTALDDVADATSGERTLLGRCVTRVKRRGTQLRVEALPDEVAAEIAARMAEADPHANIELAFSCPDCGQAGSLLFDIASFLWTEVDAWARRTIREIHELATAYGWREADVLALSGARRRLYLSMVSG